jgi:hypothetical protein
MIFFKSCPRCEGDRCLENDTDGWYMLCLACGFVTYPLVTRDGAQMVIDWQKSA